MSAIPDALRRGRREVIRALLSLIVTLLTPWLVLYLAIENVTIQVRRRLLLAKISFRTKTLHVEESQLGLTRRQLELLRPRSTHKLRKARKSHKSADVVHIAAINLTFWGIFWRIRRR